MKYPAILQHPTQEHGDIVYLAISKHVDGLTNAVCLFNDGNYGYKYGDKTRLNKGHKHVNITREYLEGKCVKIESPEHSEFVQKLAFNAGFEWTESGKVIAHTNAKYLFFYTNGDLAFGASNKRRVIEVVIPLPPKATPKEWPQVGDSVTWGKGADNAEIKALDDYSAWVKNIHGNYYTVDINKLRKPKTEDEILRDELHECITDYSSSESLIDDLINKFNITKKV